MADFAPFNLGQVLQSAETIKVLRRQEGDDLLRRQYMQTNIAGAQQQQSIVGEQFKQQQDERLARKQYYLANAVLSSADPKATAEAIAPDFVEQFEKQHGAGTWKALTPEQAVQAANLVLKQATSVIGPQTKVKWIDSGGQQIAVDEATGQPLKGVAPIAKTASPDTLVNAQTSIRGQDLSAGTARRGQDISAQTALLGQQTTVRGQDLSAETIRRGQDLSASTAIRGQDKAAGTKSANVTEGERKAAALGTRLEGAMRELAELEKKSPGASRPGILERGAEAMYADTTANLLRSPERQQANAAQLDALDAALTLATGAAYTKEQLANLRTSYFPQIGDSKETVKAKEARFKTIVDTARIASGRAEPSIDKALEGPARVMSDADYAQLPSGAQYMAPDGTMRTKR